MSIYDKYFKAVGLKKMPDAEELAEIIEALVHTCELTHRQKMIVRAIAEG